MTETNKKDEVILEQVLCVYHLLHFWINTVDIRVLIDSNSEINIIIPAYVSKLSLQAWSTNVGAQKSDDSTLQTFGMVLASFQVEYKLERARFFQETVLLADIGMKMVLGILFLILSNANV